MSKNYDHRAYSRKWRAARIAAGRCPRCGDSHSGDRVECAECLRVKRIKYYFGVNPGASSSQVIH